MEQYRQRKNPEAYDATKLKMERVSQGWCKNGHTPDERGAGRAGSVFAIGGDGAAVWPIPPNVRDGVVYGPNGTDYTGTYADKIRLELETGRLAKPIGDSLSILL